MVVFNSITLREKLNEYDKESLKFFAGDLDIRKVSQLKKADLVDRIAEHLLNPDVMFYRMSILDDKAIAVFEKGFDGPVEVSDLEFDIACRLNEMDYGVMSRSSFIVPSDVVTVWKQVRNEDFEAYRKRASWVWKCLHWTEDLYGYTPIKNLIYVSNVKKGFRMKDAELIEMFDHFPVDQLWTIRIDDIFISSVYAGNMDALRDLQIAQADKEFYIPTTAEVEELFDTGVLLSDKPFQDLLKFLQKDMKLDHDEAEDILYELWDKVAREDDPYETMQWFWNQFEFADDKQVEKIVAYYMPVANGTRMLANRGHKPSEIHSKRSFGPGNMPVITAGSSQAAQMLAHAAPEIGKMGFNLDLDSNASRIPVMGMPNGINGGMHVAEKKVYPNDPCPCGSGKKYKKCCGRNNKE